jgi:putative transposase
MGEEWGQADRSMNGPKVVAALNRAIAERAAPDSITLDNGSEFAGRAMEVWAIEAGVQLCFIHPGRPWRMASLKASTAVCGMSV